MVEQNEICALCDEPLDYDVLTGPLCPVTDHMIPTVMGGATAIENLHVVHAVCNARKGAAMFWRTRPLPH